MSNLLGKLRQRLYRVEETAIRAEQMQSEIANLRQTLERLEGPLASLMAMGEANQALIAETRGIAYSAQLLAGDGLSSTNEWRLRGLDQLDAMRRMEGRMMAQILAQGGETDWRRNQFSVYSQFGEDGLIQFLLREISIENRVFVEFGVEDYRQATTRFLLQNDRWRGLVMDGSDDNIAALQTEHISRWYDLTSVATFITRENIDAVLHDNGFTGLIGLLCVDIDGNDYWVWEAITAVDPVIVIVEYNYRFGPDWAAVVPYDPAFVKMEAHASAIYYGASLSALCALADRKGYAFVGCSEGGVNAFFVRRDRLPASVPERTCAEGYVAGQHAEMRDADGNIVKASLEAQQALLRSLPMVEIELEKSKVE